MEESVSVFPSSRYLNTWQSFNCARCGKADDIAFRCDLAMLALKSMYDEGHLPRDVAEKLGYLESGAPIRHRTSAHWRCREFEPR